MKVSKSIEQGQQTATAVLTLRNDHKIRKNVTNTNFF